MPVRLPVARAVSPNPIATMKYLITAAVVVLCAGTVVQGQMSPPPSPGLQAQGGQGGAPPAGPPRRPKIDWGQCPQLEPSEKDIEFKSNILQECLRQHPPPSQALSSESIAEHQRNVTECALKIENWFDKKGNYKFDKAEKEIKNKHLSAEMQKALVESHAMCQNVAKERFSQTPGMSVVEQVQIYQGCMDAHITQHCKIQIAAQ